ncbi:unnamed protein product [Arabidopsis thaliana]|uniref:F-box associated domain-containing protein n=1 Tax=Arabidopsis thaliana TaxID=3702 RepID=A0A5S9XNS4_ARATH|nr:unnamed protein product [Arabidopsis thaliana]
MYFCSFEGEFVTIRPFCVGFGKDIITKSYKVILMYSEKNHPHGYFDGFNIKAISLDNGKQRDAGWYVLDEHEICNEQTPVYANGSLFWWTTFTSWKYRIFSELPSQILACDLHTENFRWVSIPECYTRYTRGVQMWSLNERLCLSDVLHRQCSELDVWSLQDSTQKWEQLFSFNILNIDRLDAKCWMLGLRAAHFRRIGEDQNQVSFDSLRTVIWYSPTMISPSNLLV